ncbi:MAG: alpha/beta fold hydrolase [Patescibacteria group bacterium]
MTQLFVIHGGDAFDSYEEYLADLGSRTAHLERMKPGGWKMNLQKHLGEGFDVYVPSMPNKDNAKYAEWKMWFAKIVPLMADDVILVGHSLGGIFLAKYLSEETFPKRIRATFLIAAPFNTPTEHPLADFILPDDLGGLQKQGGAIFLYHSIDDVVVPYSNAESYQLALPEVTFRSFTDRGHFNQDRFVEIEEDIRLV